ncbi:MAG: transglutaminase domain-containing protein [Phycisphaeraceae bacterium]|nr:transglutaminase domain-containing protein [Phycisphaeraceae bacterium]
MRKFPIVAVLAAVLTSLLSHASAAPTDHWYVLQFDGKRAGWIREHTTETAGVITTSSEMHLEIRRGQMSMSIALESTFEESTRGEPIRAVSVMSLGSMPTRTEYVFNAESNTVTISTSSGGAARETTADRPDGGWLTPAAASEFVLRRLAAGATEISFSTIDPASGLEPMRVEMRGITPGTTEVLGKTVPSLSCETEVSSAPGLTQRAHLAPDGTLLRMKMNLAGMEFEQIAADRELALSPLEAPEIMARTFVKPSRPLPDIRRVHRGVYDLKMPRGRMPDIPETSAQRVERIDDKTVRVTIAEDDLRAAPAQDAQNPIYLEASAVLDASDPEIIALADRSARPGVTDPAEVAERLRMAVFRTIKSKSLGVGLASASEVCRTREGDCSEHAVLLAALLRAKGIPARVVSGLVYAEEFLGEKGIFGYHMWAQALLERDGEMVWVDLDGTLGSFDVFSGTHIALAVSAMRDDDAMNSLAVLAPLLGELQIDVIDAGL